MSRLVNRLTVDRAGLERLLKPIDGLVLERPVGEGCFEAAEAPMHHYRRTVTVDGAAGDDQFSVTETVEFNLAMRPWGIVAIPAIKRFFRDARDRNRQPWWAPPDRLDTRAASVLGVLGTVALVSGYLGTLLTQTITFAAEEFDVSDEGQGVALAVIRVSVLPALLLSAAADRRGRRLMIIAAVGFGCVMAATGALVPSLPWLATSQGVARTFSIALSLLIGIIAAEEVPARCRAYALSVLVLPAALGAGMCLWVLPLADLGERGWRLVYLFPLLGLLLLPTIRRRLPESRRFEAPHAEVSMAGHGGRFWLLAAAAVLVQLLVTPAGQFQNEFLRDERGFSAGMISLFTMATATPGAIGLVIGGRLADVYGRRRIGAATLIAEAITTVALYHVAGWPLWIWALLGMIAGAARVPALGVYGAELFPTGLRGRAAGLLAVLGVSGGVVGLLAAGMLSDSLDGLGSAMAILAAGPVIVAAIVLFAFPETAGVTLEELNPEDNVPETGRTRP